MAAPTVLAFAVRMWELIDVQNRLDTAAIHHCPLSRDSLHFEFCYTCVDVKERNRSEKPNNDAVFVVM